MYFHYYYVFHVWSGILDLPKQSWRRLALLLSSIIWAAGWSRGQALGSFASVAGEFCPDGVHTPTLWVTGVSAVLRVTKLPLKAHQSISQRPP